MLDDEPHVLIRKAFVKTNRAMVRFTASLGLKPGQPKVLEYLTEHDGCTAGEVCRGCAIDKSTMAGLLPRLEEQGLVSRCADDADARVARVHLTAQGRVLAQQVRAGAAHIDAQVLASVPADARAAFDRALRAVAELPDEALSPTSGIQGTDTPR